MPRNVQLQSKIESFIVEADRHVNAVGLSVAGSRNDRSNRDSTDAPSSSGSNNSPLAGPEEPPHPPPNPQSQSQPQPQPQPQPVYDHASYSQNVPPSRGGNSRFPERQLSRVDEDNVDEFGTNGIPRSNSGRGQFTTSAVNTRPPESSLRDPAVGGRRRDSSVSESSVGPSHLHDPSHWQQPATSHYQYPYPPGPSSQSGRPPTGDSPYSAGPSHWQTAPIIMRPPLESPGYPPQDPPPHGGRHPTDDSPYSAGPSHWQTAPVVMRPPPESGYPPQEPPSPHRLNGNSSYSTAPSHLQSTTSDRPPRPPEPGRYPSQDPPPPLGGRRESTSLTGPTHWQDRPSAVNSRPPNNPSELGGYRSHDPTTSHWQNHPSDRLPIVPPPPRAPLGGRHGNPLHLQGPQHGSYESSGGYLDSHLDGRQRGSFSESPTGPSNRFSSSVSESTVTTASDGMTRARGEGGGGGGGGGFNNQSMNTWGGDSNPDDSPPAYVLMGHPESLVPDTGPSLH